MINENPDLLNNPLMGDEAHCHILGFVSKQNFRHWSSENPQKFPEKSLHTAKVTVWCAISSFAVVRTLFL
jgi:hypothetical protein